MSKQAMMTEPTRRFALALLLAVAGMALAASQSTAAEYGEDFAFGAAQAPEYGGPTAFPGEVAVWAGTCSLAALETNPGGHGDPPAASPHCIDVGVPNDHSGPWQNVWADGKAPSWRLRPAAEAGGHPDATASFWFSRFDFLYTTPNGSMRTMEVRLPPGVIGNPETTPKCSAKDVAGMPAACPPETQVGVSTDVTRGLSGLMVTTRPIYNVEPRRGNAAEFVIQAAGGESTNIPIVGRAATEDDGSIETAVIQIPTGFPLLATTVTFWGTPWAKENDKWRTPREWVGSPSFANGLQYNGIPHTGLPPELQQSYDLSWGAIKPFFANPTRCLDQAPVTQFRTQSWQQAWSDPNHWVTEDVPADSPVTDCGKLRFNPSISVAAAGARADSPGDYEVELRIPQNTEPPAAVAHDPDNVTGAPAHWASDAGRATAHLKDTVVWMPEGVSMNPSAADGLEACTLEQMAYKGNGFPDPAPIRFENYVDPERKIAVGCPDASKIGVLEIDTPLLADPIPGTVYLAEQDRNPFNSTYAIYLVAESVERGVVVKLAGEVTPDAATGRLKATFTDNPQLPFESFKLQFRRGSRAPLANPPVCGTTVAETALTPWSHPASGAAAKPTSNLAVNVGPDGRPCAATRSARPFTVDFNAGSGDAQAGAYSPFSVRISRQDGQQEMRQLTVKTPKGLAGRLRGIPYCPEEAIAALDSRSGRAELEASSCPVASRVGRVEAGAGAGPAPLYVGGTAYLAGPYNGAPLSLVTVVPAVAGPFDLGLVAVRSAILVDSATAALTVKSDPIPVILEGVPLRVRDIRVHMDRERFTINPTSCLSKAVGLDLLSSDDGATAGQTHFQVDGCAKLGFKPRLTARILDKGRRSTLRSFNPQMRFVVRPRGGDANIGTARVTLPHSIILDQSHIRTVCTRAQRESQTCPQGAIYGYARAWSPLLDEPVEGPVYLQANGGIRPLPDLLADLRGQVNIALQGFIDTARGGRLRNRFTVIPDVPVSRFQLTMRGGRRGLLVNSTDLCLRRERGVSNMHGANGRRAVQRFTVGTRFKGCSKVRAASKKRRR